MEMATGRPWTEFECSQRTIQLREDALREFWEIFVDDRPFCRNACSRHANVQSFAVFSDAMTILDKNCGWDDEEKRVGSKLVHVCGKRCREEYLKRRLLSSMLCMNSVCAGTLDDHEWVSESTITKHEEEVVCMELDYEICTPRVVQWCMLWFPAPTGFNRT